MKYQKLIYTFIMATAFAACSQDVNEAVGLDPDIESTYIDGVSDVKIQLSSGSTATRAIINNLKNGDDVTDFFKTPDGEYLGIFMLATNKTGVNPIAPEIDSWANPSGKDYEGTKYVWLDNIRATATGEKDGTDKWIATNINWADGNNRFYPFNNWYAYKFFGYYPYSGNVTANANSRVVNYTGLDGETDIIWGESLESVASDPDDENSVLRYCAKYFRKVGSKTPVISFHHMLMAFQFQIYGLEDKEGSGDYTNAKKMSISKIQIVDVPSKAQLVIAHRSQSYASYSDRITFDWTNDLIDLLEVKPIDGEAEFEKKIDQIDPAKLINVGNPVLVPIPENNGTYYINIELKVEGRAEPLTADPIMINYSDYKPGKIYNVKIGIAGPQEIKVNATLDKWLPETIEDGMELN